MWQPLISAVMFLKVLENFCLEVPGVVDHRGILLPTEIILSVQCPCLVGYNIDSHNRLKNYVNSSPLQDANGVDFFFFVRSNLKQLLRNLNHQKNAIKKYGIWVDGKKYNISFTGNSRDKKARL